MYSRNENSNCPWFSETVPPEADFRYQSALAGGMAIDRSTEWISHSCVTGGIIFPRCGRRKMYTSHSVLNILGEKSTKRWRSRTSHHASMHTRTRWERSHVDTHDWTVYNERLVKRGEFFKAICSKIHLYRCNLRWDYYSDWLSVKEAITGVGWMVIPWGS